MSEKKFSERDGERVSFTDPLDDIISRYNSTGAGTTKENESTGIVGMPTDVKSNVGAPPVSEDTVEIRKVAPAPIEDINYGDDDLDEEIRREDEARAAQRREQAEALEQMKEDNKPDAMPPEFYDMNAVTDAVDFQAGTLDIVGRMVKEVVNINKIPSGGIPDVNPVTKQELKRLVMGDLIEQYHLNGEVITKQFEDIILDNWYLDSGITARAYVMNGYKDIDQNPVDNDKPVETETVEEKPNPTININVPDGTPVTVNIDEEVVNTLKKDKKVVDIFVTQITEKEMFASKVIENSDMEGIITPYDPGINDIPVTLPISGYRMILRPLSWLEVMSVAAPTGRTQSDIILRQLSVIYKHIKWTSIGMFKDFDDFLSKTKFVDREFLLWAVLVATSSDYEDLTLTCGNKKCDYEQPYRYAPRDIIKIDPEKIPNYYEEVDVVSAGPEAIKVFERVASTHIVYRLPNTQTLIELDAPSLKDFVETKLDRMRKLFNRFYPDDNFDQLFPQIMQELNSNEFNNPEFAILLMGSILISAVSVNKNGTDYRYTNWDDIEEIITSHLDLDDSFILFNKILPESNALVSPVSFELEGFICPKCGRKNTNVPIPDIGQSLLFLLSRRYENTEIKLTESPKNS